MDTDTMSMVALFAALNILIDRIEDREHRDAMEWDGSQKWPVLVRERYRFAVPERIEYEEADHLTW